MPTTLEAPKVELDPAANNEAVIRKQAAQDAAGHSTTMTDDGFKDTSSAIDKLAEEISKKNDPDHTPEVTPAVATAPVDDAAKKAADEAAAKAAEDAQKAEADLTRAEEYFKDSPKLPPNVSPKTNESFRSVKIKAAQEISAREQEIEKLRKEIAERDEKLKTPIPPELDAEIKDLREWRAKLDVEADPKFREFDKTINGTREFIYAQLKNNPNITDKLIDEIKKFGGPDMIKWDKIWEGLKDPVAQRIIESKLADIEMAKFNKNEAIKSAKTNIQQYLGDREKQFSDMTKAHNEATQKHLGAYLGTFDWLKEQKVENGADEAKKKAVEEHNKFVGDTQKSLMEALNDDTPEMRALMIAGMGKLLYIQRAHESLTKENKALTEQLKQANETLTKMRSSSVSRMRESSAPTGNLPAPKTDESKLFSTPATQAIDDIAKSIMEARARAGAQ